MLRRSFVALPLLVLSTVAASALPACSAPPPDADSSEGAASIAKPGVVEKEWEVASPRGEMVLPDVFYAEAAQNEQVMPLTMDGGKVQIDRLVYPTLGNPNLFSRGDDQFMTVLRVEKETFEALLGEADQKQLKSSAGNPGKRLADHPYLRTIDLADKGSKLAKGLRIFAVSRDARASAEGDAAAKAGKGVTLLEPSMIAVHPISEDMPDAFKSRYTVRVYFDASKMQALKAGLYDVRMEVDGDGGATSEYQYNALSVLDAEPNEYPFINVTDSQVSLGVPGDIDTFKGKTLEKLKEFVERINAAVSANDQASVVNAPFISFNGDLHNSGSPSTLAPKAVATTYNAEARAILDVLKELKKPIFLTIGNHDGYVATGSHPKAFDVGGEIGLGGSLQDVVSAAKDKAWPSFDWNKYAAYIKSIEDAQQPGGRHVDVFAGQFRRVRGQQGWGGWIPVDASKRNMVLYDGLHQWRKTYGPTNFSWRFGKNRFVNLNSFELRQHRRSGWGMYTVNYGGGISPVQEEWVQGELDRGRKQNDDIVVIAHHDPRGGHNGKDYPFYFKQIEFRGMDDSAKNYVRGEVLNPKICQLVPEWLQNNKQQLSCLHDGLQEWMRPDPEFDCESRYLKKGAEGAVDGKCDISLFKSYEDAHPWYSGYALIDAIHKNPAVRTVLLGHTHYNSIEMMQAGGGAGIVPTKVVLDAEGQTRLAAAESTGPLRLFSLGVEQKEKAEGKPNQLGNQPFDPTKFEAQGISKDVNDRVVLDLAAAGHSFDKELAMAGSQRELAVIRLTSNADLTSQQYKGKAMFGFSTLLVSKRQGYDRPQINEIHFYLNEGGGSFAEVKETLKIDRTATFGNYKTDDKGKVTDDDSNPLRQVFSMKK